MGNEPPTDFGAQRFIAAGLGATLMGLAGWIALRNLSLPNNDAWIFWVPIVSWLVSMALLCWWSALGGDREETRARIQASWRAGWWGGGIGLALGFLGPLALTPKANLGPLLGILLTGPVGFALGALIGAVVPPKAGRSERP